MEKSEIFGINIDSLTKAEAVEYALSFIGKDKNALVVTPNAEIIKSAVDRKDVFDALTSANLILPDGEGVVWAAKTLGVPVKEKVAGVEFGAEIIKSAAERGHSLFFLGGKPGIAERAAEKLKEKYRSLNICGTRDGYFDKNGAENDAVLENIANARPDILFVCLGAPAQELWVAKNRERLTGVGLIACLGGSLDIYSGEAKRAPRLFVKMKLEWFWRLVREPWRLPRMMNIPKFMIYVKKYKKEMKKQAKRGAKNES